MSGIVAQNVGRPSGLIKAVAAGGGTWVEIKSITASSSSTISFVNGTSDVVLDSTYPAYCFRYINIHPQTNDVAFQFNGSTDSGSNYNVTKTTSAFNAYSHESSGAALTYRSGEDMAQGTGFHGIQADWSSDNDHAGSGMFYLFNPSSTTFVKQFLIKSSNNHEGEYAMHHFIGGYFNTTSAIDAIQFKMSSGNIDAGTISLFGIG